MTSGDLPFQYDIGRRRNYEGRGQEVQIQNIKAYVCQPASDTNTAVILVHDIFGWQFPDTRYVADIIASNGYTTICPDFFLGKVPWTPSDHWQKFGDWLKDRDPMKVDKTVDTVLKYLKEQYNAIRIGIVGFSWGGMAVHHVMLTNPELKAGVSLYGIIRDSETRYNLLNPTFFIFGEKDHTISLQQWRCTKQGERSCSIPQQQADCLKETVSSPLILASTFQMAEKPKFCPCDLGDVFDYQPLGCEVSIEHIKAYVKKPSFQTDAAVLVIHDIFGGQLPNTRYIADLLASNGYITICPDFFRGEPWKPSDDISKLNEWLKTRDPKKIDREIDVVLKYLKEECNVTRIGVIGFCWGGSAVHHLMLNYSIFSVGVSIYGAVGLMEDNFNLKNPTFFIVAEKDEYIPLDKYTQVTKKLEQQCKVDFEVKIYPGQTHGFVHRKREDINPQDKPYIEEARRDMLAWLCKYI